MNFYLDKKWVGLKNYTVSKKQKLYTKSRKVKTKMTIKKENPGEQKAVAAGEFKIDESQENSSSSTQSSWFSWSGLSRQFSTQKRELSDN